MHTSNWEVFEVLHERYSLFEVIGKGRGGVVRRGFDHVLKRDAAVKTMEDTPEARREVQMLGQLQHPRIAGFCDAVIHKGKIHLIMELGRGGTSRQRRLTLEDLLEVGQDAAKALSYLHNLGFIHGDVKPSHLVFFDDGRVKLVDFGSSTTIGDGSLGGTRGYIAPERRRGAPADPRMDVYSLGKTLLALAKENRIKLPAHLRIILQKATAFDPKERFQDMDEFLEAFQQETPAKESQPIPYLRGLACALFTLAFMFFGVGEEVYPAVFTTFLGPGIVGFCGLYSPLLALVSLAVVVIPLFLI